MTEQDREEFIQYLRICTNSQVLEVIKKEREAGRKNYVELAKADLERRGLK